MSYDGSTLTEATYTNLQFSTADLLVIGSAFVTYRITTQVFRDTSAWYHLAIAVDTTQTTANDRIKIYVNGTQITAFNTTNNPSLNADLAVNATFFHRLGSEFNQFYFDGYLADVHFIDGQALDPSSFGEFDTNGVWQPIDASGLTYGTNGFHLPFSDNSTTAALGTDTSGNGNTWTVNNISVGFPVTQNYSATTTGTAPTPFLSSYYAQAFNGDTSTSFSWTPGTWAMDWTSLPSAVTVASTLRIYCYPRLGTLTVNINGSNVASITGNTVDWRTISFTGTINTISFNGTDTYTGVYAIEVDGAILIDPRANSVNDSLVDSPTNYGTDTGAGGEVRGNYATWNPLDKDSDVTLSNGNLDTTQSAAGATKGTVAVATGKWYWEITKTSTGNQNFGIATVSAVPSTYVGGVTSSAGFNSANGDMLVTGSAFGTLNGSTVGTTNNGDVLGLALDLDGGTLKIYRNGTLLTANHFTISNAGNVTPAIGTNVSLSGNDSANFGQRPFAYTAPSGFKALCTTNLPEPTIADGSTVMDVALYTGNNGTQTISGLNFSPDFVWLKGRSNVRNHGLFNTVAGVNRGLHSNLTDAEFNDPSTLTTFNSDGFALGTNVTFNGSTETFVAWTWDAGSSTVTNTDGSISSQVRANASAGFSVVTFTYPSSGSFTVGHGLNATPGLIITKHRTRSVDWFVYHSSLGKDQRLSLNTTGAVVSDSNFWGSAAISSATFGGTVGSSGISGDQDVAYCWTPVAGYSAFGSYTGNGSADGPFVYTGFRPRWVMIKCSSSTGDWAICDTQRGAYNAINVRLLANEADAELSGVPIDTLSNGFKIRNTFSVHNTNGATYVWAAFAEHPFATSRAR